MALFFRLTIELTVTVLGLGGSFSEYERFHREHLICCVVLCCIRLLSHNF